MDRFNFGHCSTSKVVSLKQIVQNISENLLQIPLKPFERGRCKFILLPSVYKKKKITPTAHAHLIRDFLSGTKPLFNNFDVFLWLWEQICTTTDCTIRYRNFGLDFKPMIATLKMMSWARKALMQEGTAMIDDRHVVLVHRLV